MHSHPAYHQPHFAVLHALIVAWNERGTADIAQIDSVLTRGTASHAGLVKELGRELRKIES